MIREMLIMNASEQDLLTDLSRIYCASPPFLYIGEISLRYHGHRWQRIQTKKIYIGYDDCKKQCFTCACSKRNGKQKKLAFS